MRGFAYILIVLAMRVPFVHAQATSRISFCLNLAHGIQEAAFKEKKQYITKEDDIRKQLTSGCASLRYEFTPKGNGGFRVTAEQNGESWVIDDQRELIQLSSPDDPKPAVGGGAKAAKPGDPATAANGKAPLGKPGEKTINPGVEAAKRMEQCFAKSKFNTEVCRTFFDELEKKCGGENVPLKRLCLELEAAIAKIDLADCIGDEENFGKCELRRRALEKKCSNPLRSSSGECRGLAKFNASLAPPTEAPVAPRADVPRAPAQAATATPAPAPAPHVLSPDPGYSRIESVDLAGAKTLEPSLRTLLRLRPVVYDSKMSRTKEMGFVTEEVELVNPQLVTYNSSGKAQTVKFTQFSALLTSGVQELYNMCKADGELQKDLISRMVSLERENGALKRENAEFKKLLFNLSNDLQELKDKVKAK